MLTTSSIKSSLYPSLPLFYRWFFPCSPTLLAQFFSLSWCFGKILVLFYSPSDFCDCCIPSLLILSSRHPPSIFSSVVRSFTSSDHSFETLSRPPTVSMNLLIISADFLGCFFVYVFCDYTFSISRFQRKNFIFSFFSILIEFFFTFWFFDFEIFFVVYQRFFSVSGFSINRITSFFSQFSDLVEFCRYGFTFKFFTFELHLVIFYISRWFVYSHLFFVRFFAASFQMGLHILFTFRFRLSCLCSDFRFQTWTIKDITLALWS